MYYRSAPSTAVQSLIQELVVNDGSATYLQVPSETLTEEDVNVALGGKATQSSTHNLWYAENAIDGIKNNWTKCSSTGYGTSPFWRLDLQEIYRVYRVVVTNRIDCCETDINGTEIRIGNSLENSGNNNPRCVIIHNIRRGQPYSFSCNGMVGRFVNLMIPGPEKVLTLCEVEVYGTVFMSSRSSVKINLQSSADLTDPEIRDKLLEKLASALKISVNVSWIQPPVEDSTEPPADTQCP
ncbi:fucolectin-4-like [Danio aesculapii]|uniref:fucolectin-4-like n=1 Tax=Danio aesculapii TaxID=1142201 RepID=UPI0024C06D52|nr:fucolectin-4-like [Danio aesculapii]